MVKFVAKHLLPYTKVVDGLMTTISRMQIMGVPFTSYSIPRIVAAYDYPSMPSQGDNVPKRGNAKEPLADRNFSRGYTLNPSQRYNIPEKKSANESLADRNFSRGYALNPSQGYNIPEKGNAKELLAERKFSRERYLTWLDEYNKVRC
jgi:hypothetical protein